MADITGAVVGAVACVAQCLSPPGGHRINRWRQFNRNFKILKTKLETLTAESRSIQRDVDAAKRNGDGIKENVQIWLKRAEELEMATQKWLERASKIIGDDQASIRKDEETAEAGEIGGEAEIAAAAAGESKADEEKTAAKKRCFKGLCPNLKSRYQLSKEAETLLEDVVKHLEAGKFDKISYPVIPRDPRLSSKGYEAFKSRTSTLENVISSLSDPNVNIVGIYGMGGIGKTTLAKEVANQSETNKLFDLVIFVEVTEKPDKMKMQREIAERLGLTFSDQETESGRAAKLHQRLEKEKNILIILDNIWAELNLQTIGIPLGDGRKLLLTARSVNVLSAMTESRHYFPVQFLDDAEAWQLFKKMSSDNIEGSEFESVAREVANKCARLPIVIVTVARALRNKELFEWEDALQQMKTQSSENMRDIQESIELSYNYLSPVLKKTIMLIRYANLTSIDQLLMFGMGLDLFERIDKLESRRTRVRTLIKQLKDSCLLLDSNTTYGDFSMHDVVRDAVISIASREGHVFTNELSDEIVWSDENALKVCHSIVLNDIKTGELPQVLECQQLKLLSISVVHSYSLKFHDNFFIRMTELKVLVLYHVDLLSLPSSLRFLTNLRALGLYGCQLDDIAIIGDLQKLEILSLEDSYIEQLPEELGHLTRLKSLDLRGCFRLGVITPYVLSRLSHLEELYMGRFLGWEEEGLNKDRKNVSLDELKHMPNLTCLEIQIRDAKRFSRDLFFNKLERYKINIGQHTRIFHKHESCRILSLINTNIFLNDGHIMQLKKIEELCVVGSQDMKNVLYGLDKDGFQQLKYLEITDNDNLLYIVDPMKYATNSAFPVLKSLLIQNLINLEKICHSQFITESSFSQLRKIKVTSCTKLKNIFSFSIARRLQVLQSIDVSWCQNMKEIFAIESEDKSNCNISEVIDNIKLYQLRSLKLCSLPQFKSLENGSDTFFSGKVALPSLEVLELDKLNVERIWQNQFAAMCSNIQNLTRLIVTSCKNLRCLFSSSLIRSFVRLKYLKIHDCPCIEEIIVVDERKHAVFPQLQFLTMSNLENLSRFWSGDSVEFSSLKILEIIYCPKLKEFVQNKISTNLTEISLPFFNEKVALPSFEMLKLDQLNSVSNIERISQWDLEAFATMSFGTQNLTRLILNQCNNLRCLFSYSSTGIFVRLQYLEIQDSPSLEEIIVVNERKDIVFPQLQYLTMENLENLSKFCSADSIKFPSLKEMGIGGCYQLREFMVKYMSMDSTEISLAFFNEKVELPSLEKLELIGINAEWIWQNPAAAMSSGIQNLTKLRLIHCNNLKCLFSSSMIGSFDKLQHLEIYNCPALKEIMVVNDEDGLRKEERKNNIFPNLERLSVGGKNISIIWEFSGDLICKISYLEIDFDESTVISSLDFLQRFHSIKKLQIKGGKDLKYISDYSTLAKISNLNKCFDLKYIFKEASKMDHLIHLEVTDCDNLVNPLGPSSTSFRNLTSLEVYKCKRLTNIVTSSTAKSMGQLRKMKIIECNMITELVSPDEGDEAKDYEIVFGELKELHLERLQSLTSFCSANYNFKFPSLEELHVIECLEMKSFSRGNVSTPMLQKVNYTRYWQFKELWSRDLNTTIQQLHKEKYGRLLTMTNVKKNVSSSSNNVQMMFSYNDEVDTEDEDEEDVVGSSNVETQNSNKDSGQPLMQQYLE